MNIQIATAKTRKATLWTNREMEWQDFATRLATRYDTQESFAEYQAMTKAEKGDIKDVGGFVGGFLFDGKRKKANVKYRSLLCLDLDNCDASTRDKIHHALERYQYVYYTTHSHSVEAPKFRVVIPLLDKIADPIKYEALGRFFASQIDIETIDRSTFEMERLMYYPSSSYDAEFLSHFNKDGEFVNHEFILANAYDDYTDISSWAYSSLEQSAGINFSKDEAETTKKGARLADPTEKDNLVGVFCRAYDVHEAILRYLPDVYRKEDHNHYTYINGSSTRGLVVLDFGKVAYSHHSTDPVHGKAVNAFDLVRLHKFGYLDEGARKNTNFDKLPSMAKMWELMLKEPQFVKELSSINLAKLGDIVADADFNVDENSKGSSKSKKPTADELFTMLIDRLELGKKGEVLNSPKNLDIILDLSERTNKYMYYDEFTGKKMMLLNKAWDGKHKNKDGKEVARIWSDSDDAHICGYIEDTFKIKDRKKILDAVERFYTRNSLHPIKDFIACRPWDGIKRVETLFIDYLGARDTPMNRALARKILSACVARVFSPGIKYDQITVFVGREGLGKSTFIKALGQSWFDDSFQTVEGKEAMSQLADSWLIEIAELQGLKKAEMTAIKAFISKQKDQYRPAYGKNIIERPRQCVFFATTNESNFLKNENGNRRFWVIEVGEQAPTKSPFLLAKDSYEVQQIMAEALEIWKAGETLYLSSAEAKELIKIQTDFEIIDDRVGLIEEYLKTPIPFDWNKKSKEDRVAYYKMLNQFNAEASGTYASAIATYRNTGEMPEGYSLRKFISPIEIKVECLGLNPNSVHSLRETKDIRNMMKYLSGIKAEAVKTARRVSEYGMQKGFTLTYEDENL